MIQRFLLLSAFVLFSSIIVDTPRSLAAPNDPASIVGDIGTRAPVSSDNRFGFRIPCQICPLALSPIQPRRRMVEEGPLLTACLEQDPDENDC